MIVYHITTRSDWQNALLAGQYTAPSLPTEGFIHASTAEQVAGTANLFFQGQVGLVILEIDTQRLNCEVRFDAVQTHGPVQYFPHIYGPININAVTQVFDFTAGQDGKFQFKAE